MTVSYGCSHHTESVVFLKELKAFTRLVLITPLQYYVNLYSTKRLLLFVLSLMPCISGVIIDYKHIRFAVPALWDTLFYLYDNYFETSLASKSLKT